MKRSRLFPLLILPLVLAAAAYGGWRWWQASQIVPSPYRTASVTRGDLVQTVSATGTINPVRVVNVGTQVSGTVRHLYVDYNTRVEQGQVLLQLDTDILSARLRQSQANLATAKARLVLAQTNVERMRDLRKQDYASQQELDQSEADFAAARATVQQTQAQVDSDTFNLNNATIRSPVSGVVIDKSIDLGQTVAANFQTPNLLKIAEDMSRMQINASFSEADLGRIREGQDASFRVDAFPGRVLAGKVRQVRLNPVTTQNVVTYDVVIDVDNPDHMLLPGMTAYVDIDTGRRSNVLLVPNSALRYRPSTNNGGNKAVARPEAPRATSAPSAQAAQSAGAGRQGVRPRGNGEAVPGEMRGRASTVFVLDGAEPRRVELRTGLSDNRLTEVISGEGLAEGMTVIIGDVLPEKQDNGARPLGAGNQMRRF